MLDLFERVKSAKLQGFIVWLPMVGGDGPLEAEALISKDPRLLVQGWDGQRVLGEAFAHTLKLNRPAWDVYLIYDRGIRWTAENPPAPSFWMHQLGRFSGADPALHLEPAMFEQQVSKRLEQHAVQSARIHY